jgi:hypothetical protein
MQRENRLADSSTRHTLQGADDVPERGGWRRRGWTAAAMSLLVLAWSSQSRAACTTSICSGGNPCTIPTGIHRIDAGCVLDFGATDVVVSKGATLLGDNNGDNCYQINARNLTVKGTLRARGGCIVVNTTADFTTDRQGSAAGIVDVSGASGDDDASEFEVTAGGAVVLNGKNITASGTHHQPGGDIRIAGQTVSGSSRISTIGADNHGGTISIQALSGDASLSGRLYARGSGTAAVGGYITIIAAGALSIAPGTTALLQATGSGGGYGGGIDLGAYGGAATVNGNLNVNGVGAGATGGVITVEGQSISSSSLWTATGYTGGDGGQIEASADGDVPAGNITTTASSIMRAWGGAGGQGGTVELEAIVGAADLSGDIDVRGTTNPAGGFVSITAGTTLDIRSASRIEADSSGTGATDGEIQLSACTINIAGDVDAQNSALAPSGAITIKYQGALTVQSGSSMLADMGEGIFIGCRCVDSNPADGTCDTPASCVSSPSFVGTVAPAPTIWYFRAPVCN